MNQVVANVRKAVEIASTYAKDELSAVKIARMALDVCSSKVLLEDLKEDLMVKAVVKQVAAKMRAAGIA